MNMYFFITEKLLKNVFILIYSFLCFLSLSHRYYNLSVLLQFLHIKILQLLCIILCMFSKNNLYLEFHKFYFDGDQLMK